MTTKVKVKKTRAERKQHSRDMQAKHEAEKKAANLRNRGQFGYRKLLYYKDFPGMSKPVFMVSVCSSVKIKG
ncbi:hypothetical protein ACOY9X_24595, partial [Citrobacter freundii complex sp. 2024EL-00748]